MKIIKAYINGYGRFHDKNFEFAPGFNLFYGPNEAGKTTLMSFLRAIYFGFPKKRDAAERYVPLSGGTHGGSVEIETSDNKKLTISLKPGRTLTGEISVLGEDGAELSGEEAGKCLQAVLHGVSETIFRSVFAFSLTELQRLDTLQNEEIDAQIYSAGTGVGDVTLPTILKLVEDKRDKIYKHGRSVQIVPKIVKELEKARSEIADIQKDRDRYKALISNIEKLKEKQAKCSYGIEEKRKKREKASRLKAGRENVKELKEIEKQLLSINVKSDKFPADGVKRLELFEDKLAEKRQEHKELKKQEDNFNTQFSSIKLDDAVLNAESYIKSLIEDRSAEMENIDKIQKLEAKIASLGSNASNAISNLGSGWGEDRINSLDVGNEVSLNVRSLTDKISNTQVSVEKAESTLAQAKKSKQDAYEEFQVFSRNLEELKPKSPNKVIMATGIPITILLSALLGITLGPIAGIITAVFGAIIITTLYYLKRVPEEDTDESNSRQMLILKARRKSIVDAVKLLRAAREEHKNALGEWQEWLRDSGFGIELDRDGVFVRIDTIKKIKDHLRNKDEAVNGLENIKKRAQLYLDRVNSILYLFNIQECRLGNISESINKIDDKFKLEIKHKETKASLKEKIKECEEKEKKQEKILDNLKNGIKVLLKESFAGDPEEFRKIDVMIQKRDDLRERRNILEIQLTRLVGSPAEIKSFKEEVARESNSLKTDRSIKEMEERLTKMEGDLSNIVQEIGAKKNQLSELEAKDKLAGLRFQEESLKAKLQKAITEWSVNALCYKLLDGARVIYERERQPFVLKHAGENLSTITAGRYVKVIKKTDDNRLVVETPEGQQKNVTALSRGTAEQLYLSMRLAFIKEYANRMGTLPLIVDDILVNFDPQRADATMQLINEVSKENQVVMFSCHPGTIDLCKKEIDGFKGPIMLAV